MTARLLASFRCARRVAAAREKYCDKPTVQREFLTSEWVAVYRSANRSRCAESALVLASVGIASRVETIDGQSQVLVTPDQVARAMHQLFLYGEENRHPRVDLGRPARNVHPYAPFGVLLYLFAIAALGDCALLGVFGRDWFAAGHLSLASLAGGEQWWRLVTALTLHNDLPHLLGNTLFGAVFGLLVGRAVGIGIGWLAILVAGAAGNLLSLALTPVSVASIGASTGVFAALGLVGAWSGMTQSQSVQLHGSWLQRALPWLACLTLLSLTAVGDPTVNVAAHLSGFIAGLVLGVVIAKVPRRLLWSHGVQVACGLGTVLLVGVGWLLALA